MKDSRADVYFDVLGEDIGMRAVGFSKAQTSDNSRFVVNITGGSTVT